MGEPRFNAPDIPVELPAGENGRQLDANLLDITNGTVPEQLVVEYAVELAGQTFEITCVSMGNPHAVAFIDRPVDEVELDRLGPSYGASPHLSQESQLPRGQRGG